MSVRTESMGKKLIAYLSGEIDHHTAMDIRKVIDMEITQLKPQELVLDFEKVVFMDSSGIGLIMGRYNLMKEHGGAVILQGMTPQTKKVMRISGIDMIAKIK